MISKEKAGPLVSDPALAFHSRLKLADAGCEDDETDGEHDDAAKDVSEA
jgi:hypothetical protein